MWAIRPTFEFGGFSGKLNHNFVISPRETSAEGLFQPPETVVRAGVGVVDVSPLALRNLLSESVSTGTFRTRHRLGSAGELDKVQSYAVNDRRRVGVFGGTFDPPHIAHVVLAAAAIEQLDLDELIVTVAGVPWQKVGDRSVSPADVRLAMASAAFAPVDDVVVSDIEVRRSGNSYTIDTLESLDSPNTDLVLLLGSDAAQGLDTWERHDEIAERSTIAVFPRRGYESAVPPEGFAYQLLDLPGMEISSTDIRNRAASARPIVGLVPEAVRRIVFEHRLYVAEDQQDPPADASR